jgi:hypothetical protein
MEKTAFQYLMSDRGQIQEMSPKCHLELAGVGIEYNWGKAKMHFPRRTDHVAKHLHANIHKAMSIDVLTLLRVHRYARKAKSYRFAYSTTEGAMTRVSIENQMAIRRSHRSSVDADWKFINES